MNSYKIGSFLLLISVLLLISCVEKEPLPPQIEQNKPVIRMAYSWGHGFKNTIADYKEDVMDRFILETEESIGLNHKQKILIDLSSDTLPDVFMFWSYETNLKYLAENGYLLDVQEYFDASHTVSRDDFYAENLRATEIQDINYAVPHEVFFGFMAANKALFEKYELGIPSTWDDIRDISPVFLENDIIPLYMGSFRGDPGHLFFSALAYQDRNGYSDTMAIKDTLNFKTPGNLQAAEAIIELIEMGAIPKNTIYSGSFEQQVTAYNQRKTALSFSFNWSLALFNEDIVDETIIIPVPRISGDSRDTSSFTVGGTAQSVCINKESWDDPEKRATIIEIVDWLLSDKVFITRMKQSGTIPAKKMELPKMDNPMYDKVFDFVDSVEVLGIHEFYFNSLGSFDVYKEANDLLWSGVLDRDEFLEIVQKGIEQNNE